MAGAVANWRLVSLLKEKDSLSSSPLMSDSNAGRALCEIFQIFENDLKPRFFYDYFFFFKQLPTSNVSKSLGWILLTGYQFTMSAPMSGQSLWDFSLPIEFND